MFGVSSKRSFTCGVVVAAVLAGLLPAATPAGAGSNPTFTFSGGGFGHGVGMSQWGAKGRAEAGHSAAQIVGAYYPGSTITPGAPTRVAVKLGTYGSTTLVQPSGTMTISAPGRGTVAQAAPGQQLRWTTSGGRLFVSVAGGSAVDVGGHATIGFTQGTPFTLGANGRRYRWGRLELHAVGSGIEVVIDNLHMNHYLYGVAEVPTSWPQAALRAQALAARTFAVRRLDDPRSSRYHLVASTSDQYYKGYDHEVSASGNQWIWAVNSTDGQYLTHGGQPILSVYSSSNGGHSEDSGYVWFASLPYLPAVADPFDNTAGNSNHRWTRDYTGHELGTWLQNSGHPSVGTVLTLDVVSGVGASGRLDKATLKVTGHTGGSYTLSGSSLRSAVNRYAAASRQLKSTKFSISGGVAPEPPGFAPGGQYEWAVPWGDAAILLGWAVDLDAMTAPVQMQYFVNGNYAGTSTADWVREDLYSVLPWFGKHHGFVGFIAAPGKRVEICVRALSIGPGSHTDLGCKTITR